MSHLMYIVLPYVCLPYHSNYCEVCVLFYTEPKLDLDVLFDVLK